ncbi:MAG TPA: hypothetical protein VNE86_06085 [Nitrososphaerales archaeon]|nr:hypothetical protein [Nitrososphaerales archaeon]
MNPQMPPGKAVGFKPLAEEWNYYSIDDGYVLAIKVVLTKVFKTGQNDPLGAPIYFTQHQPAIQVLTREEYRNMTASSQVIKE